MYPISKVRFDALASYCREPITQYFVEEIKWFQVDNEKFLITILYDKIDNDYGAIILARDLKERYRCIALVHSKENIKTARNAALSIIQKTNFDEDRIQGDERGRPVDFFLPSSHNDKLNENFKKINSSIELLPAKEIISSMMRWHEDIDGNFIEQFQTTGFDSRIWELYLFAMLKESGYSLDRKYNVPDFVIQNCFSEKLCIEATTVNPSFNKSIMISPPQKPATKVEYSNILYNYLPIKYAGPLTNKLGKKYWDQNHILNIPFLIAIFDAHAPHLAYISQKSLPIYLYGNKVKFHKWKNKTINSGFFNLPDAENISAVITNKDATIYKFNKMGIHAGFGINKSPTNIDLNVKWIDGMEIYHNPRAIHPLDKKHFPHAKHYFTY